MQKRKICVVTGTRAEYGLLYWLMKKIAQDDELELQLVVTGMHFSPEFGLTYKQIEADGFIINEKVEMLLSGDTPSSIAKSIGLGTIGFADVFARLQPDLLVLLGDRFEMLAAAQTALVSRIPIAHIHGGELTYGAFDDAIRHSITKMANWHFVSSETHRKRVIQLGENPSRVWNVGALGIENVLQIPLLTKQELLESLEIEDEKPLLLVTYHPETTGEIGGIDSVLDALALYKNYNVIFTKSNADNGGREINSKIERYIQGYPNMYLFDSLGQTKYLSAVRHAEAVIGNSSSGLIEVPYLKTPTVNCGSRQSGRECPSSVIHTSLHTDLIQQGIEKALRYDGAYDEIFGSGKSSEEILMIIKQLKTFSVVKEFYDR